MAKVRNCDVLISVGTSGVVTPAAAIPEIALSSGAIVVHVNIAYVSLGADKELMVIGKASEAISALLRPCYTS
jgi:NAD-dependent deacetylase